MILALADSLRLISGLAFTDDPELGGHASSPDYGWADLHLSKKVSLKGDMLNISV